MIPFLLVLLGFPLIGAGLKIIDETHDADLFNRRLCSLVTLLTIVLYAFFVVFDLYAATILFAIIVGVTITGKIDNGSFLFGVGSVLFFFFFFYFFVRPFVLLPLSFVFLSAAGSIDEIGNDYIDSHIQTRFRHHLAYYFFGRRYLFKFSVFYLVLLGVVPWHYLIAMILFDEAYILVGIYSEYALHRKKN